MNHSQWMRERERQYGNWRTDLVDAIAESYRNHPGDDVKATLTYIEQTQRHEAERGINPIPVNTTNHGHADMVLKAARNLVEWEEANPEPTVAKTVEDKAADFAATVYFNNNPRGRRQFGRLVAEHLRSLGHICEGEYPSFKFDIGQTVRTSGGRIGEVKGRSYRETENRLRSRMYVYDVSMDYGVRTFFYEGALQALDE